MADSLIWVSQEVEMFELEMAYLNFIQNHQLVVDGFIE
jgi:hypothetical protein